MNPETYYDEKAPYYDGEYRTRFDDLYRDITWNTITQFLPSSLDSVILDAGGGTGEWAIPLAEKGYRVVLADISRGMLRQARLKCEARGVDTIQFKRVNICTMNCFSDESFDMVLIQGDPLSYCDNAETAVRESFRVLKQGTHCIASVDNTYRMVVKMLTLGMWEELDALLDKGISLFRPGFTIRYFTPQELTTLFTDAGFHTVKMVGKPVFCSLLPSGTAKKILQDKALYDRLLNLELRYGEEPSLLGTAGHLEIVGKKGEPY